MKKTVISSGNAGYSPVSISRVLVNQHSQGNRGSLSTDNSDLFNQNDQQRPVRNTNNGGSLNTQDHAEPRNAEFGADRVDTETRDQQDRLQGTREVYLFDCCGLTRELKPASQEYMPTFRVLFHIFNAFVFLFGLANLGMGLWFRIDPKVYEIHKYIETQNFTIAGWIMLFGGFLACLISFVGCLGTVKQSVTLLLCYLFTMIALMLSLVSTIIMLTIYGLGSALEAFLVKELYEQIRRKTMSTELDLSASNDATQFIDFVQVKMRCCGASDFRDYQRLGMVIPTTCYTLTGNYINAPGCGKAIRRLMDIRAGMATGFSTGSVVSQLAAILITGLMICSIYNARANPHSTSSKRVTTVNTIDVTNSMPLSVPTNYHQRRALQVP